MGGGLSLLAAGLQPDGVAAAASFHGGNLGNDQNPDSPYRFAADMKAEIYVAAAENDPSFPDDQYQRLEQALTEHGRAPHDGDVPGRPWFRRRRQPDVRPGCRAAALGGAGRAVLETAPLAARQAVRPPDETVMMCSSHQAGALSVMFGMFE